MKVNNRDIFEQIGNLFYAIAADQHVKPLEVAELKALISKDWLPQKWNEPVVSDETHCIVMAMDSAEGNKTTSKSAFSEFSKFYSLHPEVFSKDLKKKVLDTSIEITKIFKADNPFENSRLTALRELLGSDKVEGITTY